VQLVGIQIYNFVRVTSLEQQYGNSGQDGPLKSCYIPTRLFGVASLKIVAFGIILCSTSVLEFFSLLG